MNPRNALLIPVKAIKFSPDSTDKNYQILSSDRKLLPSENSVWIHQNNQLVQRIIKIGLNNNTQVEVLEGLTLNDEVVIGTQNTDNNPVNSQTSSSPFMPKRPGGDKNKKK